MQKPEAGHVGSHSWMSRRDPTLDSNVCGNGENAVAKESNIIPLVGNIMSLILLFKILRWFRLLTSEAIGCVLRCNIYTNYHKAMDVFCICECS